MKKAFLTIIPLIILIIGCAGGAKTANFSNMTLDQAIKEASDEIDGHFQANSKIALVNFTSSSEQFSAYVLDELTANLVGSRHLEVIDRQEIDLRRGELNFQMSGEVNDNSMQALGQTLGAQNIVSGSLISIGNTYRIVIRVLNVETGRVEVQYRQDIVNDSRVSALLGRGSSGGTATASASSRHNVVTAISVASFPPEFIGTWKRDSYNNTITFIKSTLRISTRSYTYDIDRISGDSYRMIRSVENVIWTVTIKLVNDHLEISGDTGTGEANLNGVWRKQ